MTDLTKFHQLPLKPASDPPHFSLPPQPSDSAYFFPQLPTPHRANNSQTSNIIRCIILLKLPSFCLSLPLTWSTQPSSMYAHTHTHTLAHSYSSRKFIAWFLAALSTGKLQSIRKSIYIPVDCEKEFPLEFDELTTQTQNNTYSRHLKQTRQSTGDYDVKINSPLP